MKLTALLFFIFSFQTKLVFCLTKSEISNFIVIPTLISFGIFCLLLVCMLSFLVYLKCSQHFSKYVQRREDVKVKKVLSNHLILKDFELQFGSQPCNTLTV